MSCSGTWVPCALRYPARHTSQATHKPRALNVPPARVSAEPAPTAGQQKVPRTNTRPAHRDWVSFGSAASELPTLNALNNGAPRFPTGQRSNFDGQLSLRLSGVGSIDFLSRSAKRALHFLFSSYSSSLSRQLGRETWHGRSRASTAAPEIRAPKPPAGNPSNKPLESACQRQRLAEVGATGRRCRRTRCRLPGAGCTTPNDFTTNYLQGEISQNIRCL